MFHPLDIVFTCIEYSTSSKEEIFAIYISRTYTILRTNKYNSCKFFSFLHNCKFCFCTAVFFIIFGSIEALVTKTRSYAMTLIL